MNSRRRIILFPFVAFLFLNATAQELPSYLDARTYNPGKPTQIAFNEYFENNNNNWALGTNRFGYTSLDGKLKRFEYKSQTVKGKEDQWIFNYLSRLPVDFDKDYIININIACKIREGEKSAAYIFWGEDMQSRHSFGLQGNNTANYQFCKNGQWDKPHTTSFPTSWSGYLYLSIIKKGNTIAIYNNSTTTMISVPYKLFNSAKNTPAPMSVLGFLMQGDAKVECNKIEVLQNKEYGTMADSAYFLSYAVKANEGNADAQYQLANMYWQGKGTSINKEKAVELYYKAAAKNHIESKANIGWIYEQKYNQSGAQKDVDSAISNYKNIVAQTGNSNSKYFPLYMRTAYPYVSWLDYNKYSLTKLPLPEKEYIAAEKARKDLVNKISEDAHFKLLPELYVALISINRYKENECYIAGNSKTIKLQKIKPADLQDRDFYFDEEPKEFLLYRKNDKLSTWANKESFLYIVRGGYKAIQLLWQEKICNTCNGKGSTGGGYGTYTSYIPNGTYTITRSQTIAGQREIITSTPNYTAMKINGYIPPVKCNQCDGAGKFPKECKTIFNIQ